MSKEEAMRFLSYRGLINADVQADKGNKSNAQGFCFGIGDEVQATKDWRRLKGIVTADYLLVGVLKPDEHFVRCKGEYIDWEVLKELVCKSKSQQLCSMSFAPYFIAVLALSRSPCIRSKWRI